MCAILALGLLLALTGCQRGQEQEAPTRPLLVYAASSLREPFTELAKGFEAAHPGVSVRLQFAGTQQLRMQLEHGARADVFASADHAHMEALRSAGHVEAPEVFARNVPVVIVATESAGRISHFEALPEAERIVLGAAEVPIGRYTAQVLKNAGPAFESGVRARVVSEELNVKQVLHRVLLGEADAGIVYRSDLPKDPAVLSWFEVPARFAVIAEYPHAVVKGGRQPELARAWMTWVGSEAGRRALEQSGFMGAPEAMARP